MSYIKVFFFKHKMFLIRCIFAYFLSNITFLTYILCYDYFMLREMQNVLNITEIAMKDSLLYI